jgi:hypothetical protein
MAWPVQPRSSSTRRAMLAPQSHAIQTMSPSTPASRSPHSRRSVLEGVQISEQTQVGVRNPTRGSKSAAVSTRVACTNHAHVLPGSRPLKASSRSRRPAVDGPRAVARHRNGREADAPDVEPAVLRRIVWISPERLYRLPGVPAEGRLEQVVRVRVSRPDTREDADLGDEARLEPARPPRDFQDAAAAMAAFVDGDGERDEKSPPGPERIQPHRPGMRGAGIHEDRVARPGVVLAAVAGDDRDVLQMGQVLARAGREVLIELDRGNAALRTNHGGQDGRVVPDPAPDVHRMISPLEVEGIEAERQEAGLPVVETPGRVDRDEHVVIEMSRVRVVGDPVGEAPRWHGREDLPRPGPEESFARNRRERLHDRWRAHVRDGTDFLGVDLSNRIELAHSVT